MSHWLEILFALLFLLIVVNKFKFFCLLDTLFQLAFFHIFIVQKLFFSPRVNSRGFQFPFGVLGQKSKSFLNLDVEGWVEEFHLYTELSFTVNLQKLVELFDFFLF
jgi:hypothetical protein